MILIRKNTPNRRIRTPIHLPGGVVHPKVIDGWGVVDVSGSSCIRALQGVGWKEAPCTRTTYRRNPEGVLEEIPFTDLRRGDLFSVEDTIQIPDLGKRVVGKDTKEDLFRCLGEVTGEGPLMAAVECEPWTPSPEEGEEENQEGPSQAPEDFSPSPSPEVVVDASQALQEESNLEPRPVSPPVPESSQEEIQALEPPTPPAEVQTPGGVGGEDGPEESQDALQEEIPIPEGVQESPQG